MVSVACGKKFTLFATDAGKVFAMGDNASGQLGSTAAGKTKSTAVQVEGLDGVKIVQVFFFTCGCVCMYIFVWVNMGMGLGLFVAW